MTPNADTDQALAPYAAHVLSARHLSLTTELYNWSMSHCTCALGPDHHARLAYCAATFDIHCTPPGADPGHNRVSAHCALLFFLADDGPFDEIRALDDHLTTGRAHPGSEAVACYTDLLALLRDHGRPVDHLRRTCRRWAARTREQQDLDVTALTSEEYLDHREHTIFVEPYAACWAALLGLPLPGPEEDPRPNELLRLAARAIIAINDLAGIATDARPTGPDSPVDINTVLLDAPLLGSLDAAVDRTVTAYRDMLAEYHHRELLLRDPARPHNSSARQAVLFRTLIDGTLSATRHLTAERYPGSRALLDRLPAPTPPT